MPKHHTANFLPIQVENCAKELRIEVETYIAAMPTRRIEVNKFWPRDWWQAFRERWFPEWWLRNFPVKYDGICINEQLYSNVCPHLQKDPRDKHLEFLAFEAKGPLEMECHTQNT